MAHNIEWNDIVSLMGQVGTVVDRQNGVFLFEVGSQSETLRRPHEKDLGTDDVVRLRKMLESAGLTAESSGIPKNDAAAALPELTYVAVVDHHSAKIFTSTAVGSELDLVKTVTPPDPHGFRRDLEHKKEADYQGQRTPEDDAYYDSIIDELKAAAHIVIVGDATGKSSAGSYLRERIASHHAAMLPDVLTVIDTDLSALTDGQVGPLVAQRLRAAR